MFVRSFERLAGRSGRALGAHLPKLVFILAFLPGLALTFLQYSAAQRRVATEFDRVTDQAVDRVVDRLQQHVVVLRATHGLIAATGGRFSRADFQRFLAAIDIAAELPGVQGLGFARMLPVADARAALDEVKRNYGLDVAVRPPTDQAWRTPIVLLEPDTDRNRAALGYDMYAEPVRRSAMDHAIASQDPQMTGPVELVQEITAQKQTGFLVYLPVALAQSVPDTSPVAGFVYAPFRGGDLIQAALGSGSALPVALRVVDTGAPDRPLFDESARADGRFHRTRSVQLFGRQWAFDIWSDSPGSWEVSHLGTVLLGLTSLLFALAAALATAARQNEAVQARAVAAAAAREADYRQMLVNEMTHRIKNHIARIQSIARQSARGATDVQAFTASFDARLQSMSAVQEILAGNASAGADAGAILRRELRQSLDATEVAHQVEGPVVRLDERQAHAFALVVHELVTNAMKYGGLSPLGAGLSVSWQLSRPTGESPRIALTWDERIPGLDPDGAGKPGFGTRLIDVALKGELSGTLTRTRTPEGLTIRMEFPLDAALNPAAG